MEIRRMKADDLPAAASLYLAAYGADWPVDKAQKYIARFFGFEPESCLVAVEADGVLSGAIIAYSFEKETGPTLFIQELYVHPDFRKHGYGRELVTRLRDSLSKKTTVKIKPLVKADTGVLNFYNSLGFERGKAVSFSFDEE